MQRGSNNKTTDLRWKDSLLSNRSVSCLSGTALSCDLLGLLTAHKWQVGLVAVVPVKTNENHLATSSIYFCINFEQYDDKRIGVFF